MPKNPSSGPAGPLDANLQSGEGDARITPDRRAATPAQPNGESRPAQASPTGGADAAPAGAGAAPGARSAGGGRALSERKKQFLISPRPAPIASSAIGALAGVVGPGALQTMGLAPLSLSSVEQALRSSPDIEVIDTVGRRSSVDPMGDGMGGSQGVLVTRMTEQKAAILHQQAQGRLIVERDQHLALLDPAPFRPAFVSNVMPNAGPTFSATIQVVNRDGAPVPGCEVSLFGSMLPANASSDEQGIARVSLVGETAASIRGLYIKPKSDYWSFYQRDPDLSADEPNVVTVHALSEWAPLAGFPRQKAFGWGQRAMRMDQLPQTYRGQGVRIAVVDSGVATSHEGLSRVRAGFDVINKKTNPNGWTEDVLGHGTHCAGMIGAADLAFGMRGFAPEAEIHACKLFPGGQVSQLIDALEYCIEHQIDVVNLSLGGEEYSETLEQQILRAKRAGVACIVAAGNSGGPVQYPGSSPHVLAVAAIGKLDEFPPDSYHAQTIGQDIDANGFFSASFSCFGPQVGVCGPGVAITSAVPPNNYAAWDGTSMAAPHVTGLAALVLAHHPDFQGPFKARTPERVERLFQIIRMSARRVSLGDPGRIGMGLPDAPVAVGLQQPQWSTLLATQALPRGIHPQSIGAIMDQPGMGMGIGLGSARGTGLEPFAVDPALAQFTSGGGFGFNPFMPNAPFQGPLGIQGLPFGLGTPGNQRGW